MPIFHQMKQGSEKWINVRLGIPTSSAFDRIVTPAGKLSASRDEYMNELLAEMMTGHPAQSVTTAMMERGHDLEPQAIAFYEMLTGKETHPIGFVTNDAGTIGASPDRIVTPKLGLECKAPGAAQHVGYLRESTGAGKRYKVQTQGQIYVAEFDAVAIISHHPQMDHALYVVKRDDEFIGKLDEALTKFVQELAEERARFIKKGWIDDSPKQPAKDDWLGVADEDVTAIMGGKQ